MDFKQFDIGALMQQAQKLQSDVQKQKQLLEEKHEMQTEKGIAGVEDVIVEVNLLGKLKKVTLNPSLFTQTPEVIGQLVCAAANQALEKAAKRAQADRVEQFKHLNLPFDITSFLGSR